jgi:CMP/dCMP kinase
MSQIVTIDGPAASGKTSVSRELARRLGWSWVSTGAFYRGLAYAAHTSRLNLNDESAVAKLAQSANWNVRMDAEITRVFFNGKDVTDDLNAESVGGAASVVSQYPKVRQTLLPLQRACVQKGQKGLVAEGRDCGSVVFPEATVKIYLTARSEDRAQRRAKDDGASVDTIASAQKLRDRLDKSRSIAPLQVPAGAHVVDTSDLTLSEVVDKIEKIVRVSLTQ